MKKQIESYTPPIVHTRKTWQKTVRVQRRVFYNTLPDSETRAVFLRHIWDSRTPGDYQKFKENKELYPTFFRED